MWNHREELTGKIRVRASRWPCGQLVLQVECARYDLFQTEESAYQELNTSSVWRDAKTADLNDLGYLSAELGQKPAAMTVCTATEFLKSTERKQ